MLWKAKRIHENAMPLKHTAGRLFSTWALPSPPGTPNPERTKRSCWVETEHEATVNQEGRMGQTCERRHRLNPSKAKFCPGLGKMLATHRNLPEECEPPGRAGRASGRCYRRGYGLNRPPRSQTEPETPEEMFPKSRFS